MAISSDGCAIRSTVAISARARRSWKTDRNGIGFCRSYRGRGCGRLFGQISNKNPSGFSSLKKNASNFCEQHLIRAVAQSTMNELEILRVIKSERKPYWGGRQDYTLRDLRGALGVLDTKHDLTDSFLSNLLRDRPVANENRFLQLISGPGGQQTLARKAVERSLGLDGLFSCKSRAEIIALVNRADSASPRKSRLRFLRENADNNCLTTAEKEAIEYLSEEILTSGQPVIHWIAPFDSGATIVVENLWAATQNTFSSIALVRPSDFAAPFETEIREISNHMEAKGHSITSKRKLADALQSENILLVVLSPFALDSTADTNSMRNLIKEFLDRYNDWSHATQVLLVGNSEWATSLVINGSDIYSRKLRRRLQLRENARFAEFINSWNRFSNLRDQALSEESGSRMRRAATYYRVQNKEDVWVITIKLRALFASNDRTAAYFDPTQGFKRLAGPRVAEFPDIVSYVDDVNDYISYVRFVDDSEEYNTKTKKRYFYNLQYASTAKHWLTEEALNVLIDKIDGSRPYPLRLNTEKRRMKELTPVINEVRQTILGEKKSNYFASIGIKALVQDDWRQSDPYERSLAHFRIADRLKRNENSKELLEREFPYEPHWGRSRIFFLSETIRHLMRSAETYAGNVGDEFDSKMKFPRKPNRNDRGTNPVEVVNYCYEVLYQRELNGNANGKWGRALAKRYGAYQLAVELLEILSHDNEIGVPHEALTAEKRIEFIRECAFALLDVGELKRAKICFERALAELKGTERLGDLVNIYLDLSLVESTFGEIEGAKRSIKIAEETLRSLHRKSVEEDARQFYSIRNLYRRLLTRKAHVEYLLGNHETTLDLIDQLESEERWSEYKDGDRYKRDELVPTFTRRLEAEQIHLLLAALHRLVDSADDESETREFARTLNRSMEAMLYAQSEGLHHQAMGFRIALARCFRRMRRLDTAETILDAVHHDLLRYGCSERTFLAFLNEAARVLSGLGDPIRAYATYLRPCIGRSLARGFRREAVQAATQAKRCLEDVRRRSDENGNNGNWSKVLSEAVDRQKKLVAEADDIFRGGPFEKDPLFAYAVADAEKFIVGLNNSAAITRHINEIDSVLSEADP